MDARPDTEVGDPETDDVLLTRTGKRRSPESKMFRWHAVRAGVGVYKTTGRWDALSRGGACSFTATTNLAAPPDRFTLGRG